MNAMTAAQQCWDSLTPECVYGPDRSAENESAYSKALERYMDTGELPGIRDATDVWDALDDECGDALCFDLLAAYRADDNDKMLEIVRQVGERLDGIVNGMIEGAA